MSWTAGSTFTLNGAQHTLTFVAPAPALSTCYLGNGDWRAALAANPFLAASSDSAFQFCLVPPTTAEQPTLKDFTYRSYLDYLREDDHRSQRDALRKSRTHFNLVDGRLIDHPSYARNTDAYRHYKYPSGLKKRKVAQFLEEHKDIDLGPVFELPCGSNFREVEALWQVWASMVFFNSDLVEENGLLDARGSGCMTSDARICIVRESEAQPLCAVQSSSQSALLSVLFGQRTTEDLALVIVQWNPENGTSKLAAVITPEDFAKNVSLEDKNLDQMKAALPGLLAGTREELSLWLDKVVRERWAPPGYYKARTRSTALMNISAYFDLERDPPDSEDAFKTAIDTRLRLYTACLTRRFERRLINSQESRELLQLATPEAAEQDVSSFLAMAVCIQSQAGLPPQVMTEWQRLEETLLRTRLKLCTPDGKAALADSVIGSTSLEAKTTKMDIQNACQKLIVQAILDKYPNDVSEAKLEVARPIAKDMNSWLSKQDISVAWYLIIGSPSGVPDWMHERHPHSHSLDHPYDHKRILIEHKDKDMVVGDARALYAIATEALRQKLSDFKPRGDVKIGPMRWALARFLHWARELLVIDPRNGAPVPRFDLARCASVADLVRLSGLPASHQLPGAALLPPCMAAGTASVVAQAAFRLSLQRDSVGDLKPLQDILGKPMVEAQLRHHRYKSIFGSYQRESTDRFDDAPWTCSKMAACDQCPMDNDPEDIITLPRDRCLAKAFKPRAREHLGIELEKEEGEEVSVAGAGKMALVDGQWYLPTELRQPSDFALGLLLLKFQKDHPQEFDTKTERYQYKFASNPGCSPQESHSSTVSDASASASCSSTGSVQVSETTERSSSGSKRSQRGRRRR